MPTAYPAPHEVIVIDAGIADWQTLVADAKPDVGIILLPAGGDGLAALATALADYGTLDALHIVSHGAAGQLHLGDLKLNSDNLGTQAAALAQIASHLTPSSDLMLYGCSVAAGAVGQTFVGALSAALGGVDVAASTNPTGAAQMGGDWDLEYWLGHINTALPFAEADIVHYNAALFGDDGSSTLAVTITTNKTALKSGEAATLTFTFTGDVSTPFTSDMIRLVGGGTFGNITKVSATVFTVVYTPAASTNAGSAEISLDANDVYNSANEGNTRGAAATISYDTQAPAAPSSPDLATASDDGASATDNITGVRTPTFTGTAEAGATVRLYDTDGTTLLGSAVATGGGTWSIVASTLADGPHTLTAVATDAAGNASNASPGLAIQIETSAPPPPEPPDPPEPPPAPPLVDGVAVTQTAAALPGGGSGTTITVPIVGGDRADTGGTPGVADIPLSSATDAGNVSTTLLLAQVPAGLGLSATGGASAAAGDAQQALLQALKAAASAGADQGQLNASGAFLALLPATVPLLVETVVPTSAADGAARTLTLTGTANASQHTALVIDASHLAAGNSIVLHAVDFAAVIGSAAVTGSTAGQILTGDGAGQQFTVSTSAGSKVFAGGGDDTLVFGTPGTQAARLDAAAPLAATAPVVTLLHGGSGGDTASFAGLRADYLVTPHDGYVVVSALATPQLQAMVVNVETLAFADASITVQNRAALATLAGLYQNVLGRQADVGGFAFWGGLQANGLSLGQIAIDMLASGEGRAHQAQLNGATGHDVALLYQVIFGRSADAAGFEFWFDAIANKHLTLVQVADAFLQSAEIVGVSKVPASWNFQV